MPDPLQTEYLQKQIQIAELELQNAFDSRKPFYEIKEIVQRLKLLINELAQVELAESK